MNSSIKNWIINASPIISLSRIGASDIILQLYPEILIPYGVYEEINSYSFNDKAKEWVSILNKRHLVSTEIVPLIASWDLGKGESQVLSLAYNFKDHGVILDDKPARNCANVYNIPLHGTIGLLIRAKQQSIIEDLESYLIALKRSGFRLTDNIVKKAIAISLVNS